MTALEKFLEIQVKLGKITQEQAEQAKQNATPEDYEAALNRLGVNTNDQDRA